MPITRIERRMRQLGRIRLGQQVKTSAGKLRPDKLETFRLTSPHRELLDAAAELYGGEVREWSHPRSNDRYELLTSSDTLDITLPPGDATFSQWFELWSGDGCERRCDGEVNSLTGEKCLCPADDIERAEQASIGRACKPTTRLNVILHKLPDVGLWRLETHGYNAATELGGTVWLASRAQSFLPAKLRLEPRTVKRLGEKPSQFVVPVIEFPFTTEALGAGKVEGLLDVSDGVPALGPADTNTYDIHNGADAALVGTSGGVPAETPTPTPPASDEAEGAAATIPPAAAPQPKKVSAQWMAGFQRKIDEELHWTLGQQKAWAYEVSRKRTDKPGELYVDEVNKGSQGQELRDALVEGSMAFVPLEGYDTWRIGSPEEASAAEAALAAEEGEPEGGEVPDAPDETDTIGVLLGQFEGAVEYDDPEARPFS